MIPAERDHKWVLPSGCNGKRTCCSSCSLSAFHKSQVGEFWWPTSVSPDHCFNSQGVDAKSEACHTTD